MSKYLFVLLVLLVSGANAQYNFWHGARSNRCGQIKANCKELLANGCKVSGTYTIDYDGPVGSLPPFQVKCDMTNDGGGWTIIIDSSIGTASQVRDYLGKFGSTTSIDAGIYNESLGFGWGSTTSFYKTFSFLYIRFTEMSITYSGLTDSPSAGLGSLSISSVPYEGYYWNQELPPNVTPFIFEDAWGSGTNYQYMLINGQFVQQEAWGQTGYPINKFGPITDKTTVLTNTFENLKNINMTGYSYQGVPQPYTKRYIRMLKVR